jgi:rRNA maturation endonuclease Nob1
MEEMFLDHIKMQFDSILCYRIAVAILYRVRNTVCFPEYEQGDVCSLCGSISRKVHRI